MRSLFTLCPSFSLVRSASIFPWKASASSSRSLATAISFSFCCEFSSNLALQSFRSRPILFRGDRNIRHFSFRGGGGERLVRRRRWPMPRRNRRVSSRENVRKRRRACVENLTSFQNLSWKFSSASGCTKFLDRLGRNPVISPTLAKLQ